MKIFEILFEQIDEDTDTEYWQPEYDNEADIRAEVFPFLQAKIEKLNKRARKLRLPEIQLLIKDEFYKKEKDRFDPDGLEKNVKYYHIELEGERPKLAGWKFIATIQHHTGGNIIRTVPGEEENKRVKDFYETDPDRCDHCKKRRGRIDTFIVQNEETNELKQVGRNCLVDFLGGVDPKAILNYFSYIRSIKRLVADAEEEGRTKGIRGVDHLDTETLMQLVVMIVNQFGYKPQGGTRGDVQFALYGSLPERGATKEMVILKELFKEWRTGDVDPGVKTRASKILEWTRNITDEAANNNNFLHNIRVLARSKYVTPRDLGFFVGMVPAYMKAEEKDRLVKQRAAKSNEWVGVVGQKIPPTHVQVVGTSYVDGPFGRTQIVRMEDEKGNFFTWFNNSATAMKPSEEKIKIVGTVKKHDEYKGRKQTILTRVKQV